MASLASRKNYGDHVALQADLDRDHAGGVGGCRDCGAAPRERVGDLGQVACRSDGCDRGVGGAFDRGRGDAGGVGGGSIGSRIADVDAAGGARGNGSDLGCVAREGSRLRGDGAGGDGDVGRGDAQGVHCSCGGALGAVSDSIRDLVGVLADGQHLRRHVGTAGSGGHALVHGAEHHVGRVVDDRGVGDVGRDVPGIERVADAGVAVVDRGAIAVGSGICESSGSEQGGEGEDDQFRFHGNLQNVKEQQKVGRAC